MGIVRGTNTSYPAKLQLKFTSLGKPSCRQWEDFAGTGVMFTKEAFQQINGFSNNFYGWGYIILSSITFPLLFTHHCAGLKMTTFAFAS
jgi:hypothetical protein